MAIAIIGDLDWTGDLVLFLEALDGGPAADVAGYAFTSSGDIEYSCSVPEPVNPANRLLGVYRCVAKTAGGSIAGVGYVTISANTTSIRLRSEEAVQVNSASIEEIREDLQPVVGPGNDSVTIEIKDDGVGIPSVEVWISSDSNGTSVVAGTLITDDAGRVTFLLTAGVTYYLWASKAGRISIQGQSFVAVAD